MEDGNAPGSSNKTQPHTEPRMQWAFLAVSSMLPKETAGRSAADHKFCWKHQKPRLMLPWPCFSRDTLGLLLSQHSPIRRFLTTQTTTNLPRARITTWQILRVQNGRATNLVTSSLMSSAGDSPRPDSLKDDIRAQTYNQTSTSVSFPPLIWLEMTVPNSLDQGQKL